MTHDMVGVPGYFSLGMVCVRMELTCSVKCTFLEYFGSYPTFSGANVFQKFQRRMELA